MSIKLGLASIRNALKTFNDPHLAYKTVHIAGTNGKGSVSAIIAHTLRLAGLNTGLYTSPHLIHPRDCIVINGTAISYAAFERIMRRTKRLNLSPFEALTTTAFLAFSEAKVDVAVVETGMGGRLDATNVITPVLSVITRVGLDHTAFLGETLEEIAAEKGGIIKYGAPVVVSGQQDSANVLRVLHEIQERVNPGMALHTTQDIYDDYRDANASTARLALQQLAKSFPHLTPAIIEQGIATTRWPGRFEHVDLSLIGGTQDATLDGAHNPQSIKALASLVKGSSQQSTFIFAMTEGKNAAMFKPLLRSGDKAFAVEFEPVDGMAWVVPASSAIISRELDATDYGTDVSGAIRDAKGKVYICGSLYLIGQVHRLLQVAQLEDTARKNVPRGPYNPALIEAWANKYLSKGNPRRLTDSSIAKRFILPPPNVTGTLHIGHALTVAIQDAYVRFFKSQGEQVTWAPGMDHAGIATQTVVAKMLAKQGVDVSALAPEDFIAEIWRYKESFGAEITNQIRRLGADLDWDLEYFTLDEERSEAVIEAFGKLWQDGLVRRDVRMVNWSDSLQSVISDIEVDSLVVDTPKIIQGAEFGNIWTIAYQMADGSGKICVQTTRPETVPGDRAIAVHPDDERYKDLIGKCVQHPLLSSVSLPIVADAMVDPLFGTGAVKLTPAHDANDYAASRRHAIELVTIFDKHGKFLPSCGLPDLVGHDRLQSRSRVVEKLAAAGALISVQQHSLRLGVCSRTGAVIEPRLMPQWFIHMQPLADKVLQQDAIQMSIQTKREWLRWLENVQDWCVSRQLVWGHRVPLYRIVNTDGWFFARSFADAQKAANGKPIVQETDVLDTWFSSGLLPLSAYGCPRDDTSPWRPLSFIESGPDILFFWLARMAMLCTHFTGFAPFKEILLHPLVRDSQGRKMSKSLGNVLDPLHIIDGCSLEKLQAALAVGNLSANEVARASQDLARSYPQGIQADGADALRFALVDSTVQDSTLNLDIRSVKAARYVGGKLWNVLNFIEFHQQTHASSCVGPQNRPQIMDHWILQRLLNLQEDVHESFAKRTLHRATSSLRFFIVNDLCDTYLEFLKYDLKGLTSREERCKVLSTLRQVMVELSLLIKPFMPFLADSVSYRLRDSPSDIRASKDVTKFDARLEKQVNLLCTILKELRALDGVRQAVVVIQMADCSDYRFVKQFEGQLKQMAKAKALEVVEVVDSLTALQQTELNRFTISVLGERTESQTTVDNTSMEQAAKRIAFLERQQEKLIKRLSDPIHLAKVPAAVLAKDKASLQDVTHKLETLRGSFSRQI